MPISVSTEITDNKCVAAPPLLRGSESIARNGWILYDGECEFCRSIVRRIRNVFLPRGFEFLPLQTPWVGAAFDLSERELLSEMRLLLPDGEKSGGADAIMILAKHVWWAWPIAVLARVPGARRYLGAAYRCVAARRYCIAGACAVPVRPSFRNR